MPIYVALDSADVWSAPGFFQLDENNLPTEVAGCPPDAFTEDGQLWGNPLYDWDAMKADGFGWWIRRIDGAQKLYDVIRIDHFRGFESYWAVPYGDTTARRGHWKPGPGMDLVGVLTSWFHDLRFIAEDLGYTTPEVEKLLADSGLPGMKVLEFGFDVEGNADYLPHNCVPNSVCYIGTHDNETVKGWLKAGKGQRFPLRPRVYAHHRGGGLVLGHDPHRHGHGLRAVRHADAGCVAVARFGAEVELTDSALEAMQKSRELAEKIADEGRVAYGITTGFGDFQKVAVPEEMSNQLSTNLILSHCTAPASPIPTRSCAA